MRQLSLFVFLLVSFSILAPLGAQNLLDESTFDLDMDGWISETGWDWSEDGRSDLPASYWGDRDPIRSESGPGALRYSGNPDSDFAFVRSRPYSFVDQPNLFLRFNQYCRRYIEDQTFFRMRIYLNGAEVFVQDINENLITNVETGREDVQIFDLSGFVPMSGAYVIEVQFEFLGQHYFWLVDDVQFYDSYPYPPTNPRFFGDSLAAFGEPYSNYQTDTANWAYVPQQLVVQFSPTATDMDKQMIRDTVGAVRIDSCACGQLELWQMTDNVLNYGDSLHSFMGTIGILSNQKGTGSTSKVDGVDLNYYNGTQLMNIMDIPLGPLTPADIANIPLSPPDEDAVRIAVLDTGVDITHSGVSNFIYRSADDLTDMFDNDDNCIINDPVGWNYVDSLNNVFDDNGHGTHVAGIIAQTLEQLQAEGDDCVYQILPYKTHDEHGISTLFDVACATYQAIEDDAAVINDSWGFYGDPSIILQNALDTAELEGVYVVSAAGNEGLRLDTLLQYPACYDNANIISVAADGVDPNGILSIADFSNISNTLVDIAAPGVNIDSAQPRDNPGDSPVTTTTTKSGTSMAAPAVSAALAKAYCAGPAEAKIRVLECATIQETYFPDIIGGKQLDLNINCLTVDEYLPLPQGETAFIAYPNPATDRVYLRSQFNLGSTQIQLLSLDGRLLYQTQQGNWPNEQVLELSLHQLPAGMYMIRVQEGTQVWTTKLVKS